MKNNDKKSKWAVVLCWAAVLTLGLVGTSTADNVWEGDDVTDPHNWLVDENWSQGYVPNSGGEWVVVPDAGPVPVDCTPVLGGTPAGWAYGIAVRAWTADTTIDFNLGSADDSLHFGTQRANYIDAYAGFTATVNLNSGDLILGNATGGERKLFLTGDGTTYFNMSGDAYLFHKGMHIGQAAGGNATINFSDDAVIETWGYTWVGAGSGASPGGTGAINISGGSWNVFGGTYMDIGVFNNGQLNVTGGELNMLAATLFAADEPGVNGTITISDGEINAGDITAALDGTATVTVTGGEISTNILRLGSIQTGQIGGTGTMNVSGGHVDCDDFLIVGAYDNNPNWPGGGHGVLNQTGGVIGIYRHDQTGLFDALVLGDTDGTYSAQSAECNLLGGELYSWAPPIVNMGWININGGKLRINSYKMAIEFPGGAANELDAIKGWITSGLIKGDNSDINPDNFRIKEEQDWETPVGNDNWLIQYPIPDCESRVFPTNITQTQDLGELPSNITMDQVYTIANYGESTTINTYTVTETPDETWLTLDKTSGGPLAPGSADTVTATVDTTGLLPGDYSVDLVFADDCATATINTRTIIFTIPSLRVLPRSTDKSQNPGDITVYAHCDNPMSYDFNMTNLSGLTIDSFTVEETDAAGNAQDHTWLTLNTTAGGPIAAGSTDTVNFTVTPELPNPEADSTVDGWIKITPSIGDPIIRQIQRTNTFIGTIYGGKWLYAGDVMPADVDSCGAGCNFNVSTDTTGGAPFGTIVDDPDADNGKAFYLEQTTATSSGVENCTTFAGADPCGRLIYNSSIAHPVTLVDNNAISNRIGATMVTRLKVERNSHASGQMFIIIKGSGATAWAQARVVWGGKGPNHPRDLHEHLNGNPYDADNIVSSADAGNYYTVRVGVGWGAYGNDRSNAANGTYDLYTVKIWFDEDTVTPDPNMPPTIDITDSKDLAQSEWNIYYDSFTFGTYNTSSNSRIYFDWISFTDTGIFAPGEEIDCIGSLIPSLADPCNNPFADADGDTDVDQDDFAEFQVCYTGTAGGIATNPAYDCSCFDRDSNSDVSDPDFTEFQKCASGPNIEATPATNPDCAFSAF
ncbi:MAG: hypothetical protein ACYTF1_07675 [Planctomycetota bacterium]